MIVLGSIKNSYNQGQGHVILVSSALNFSLIFQREFYKARFIHETISAATCNLYINVTLCKNIFTVKL